MTHRWLATALIILAAAGIPRPATAQARQAGNVEILGTAAFHSLWDDESFLGTGVAAGGGIQLALTETLSLRGRIAQARNERDFGNGVIFDADGTRYAADLIWQPSNSTHAPYVGGSIGAFSFERRSQFPDGLPGSASSGTDTLVGGLAGFTAISRGRFRLGPEVSLWWSRPNNFIAIDLGLVGAWRF